MNRPVRILYLEDAPEDVELVKATLASEYLDAEVTWVNGRDGFLAALLDAWNYDLLLVDFSLPDIGGDEALDLARRAAPDLPFVFLSGHIGDERAVECLRRGATDYVLKTNLPRLLPVVRRALEEARELAARKAAEASQARVASLLRTALESTSEGILVVDLAGRISAYNRKFLSMCGIPEFVMAPMRLDEVIDYLDGQIGDASALLDEVRLLRNQSEREGGGILSLPGNRTIQESSRPQKVGSDTVGRVLSFREASAREAPQDLLKSVGGGRSSFTQASLAARVVPWILQGDRVLMPETGPAILGLTEAPAELDGLVGLLHPEDVRLFQEALERSVNVGFPARIKHRDGGWTWTRWTVDRGVDGYRGAIQELTEEAWAQARDRERQRAEGALLAGRRLAAQALPALEEALAEAGKLADPDQGRRLATLLEDLASTLVRVRDLGEAPPAAAAPWDPDAYLDRFLGTARLLAGPGVTLTFAPAGSLPPVLLDPDRLDPALSALVANALEAQGGQGTVELATSLLYPRAHRPGSLPGAMRPRVALEVRDAGPGIPEALRGRVLEPFFTTWRGGRHAGLGLTTAREAARSLGGDLQLAFPPGGGHGRADPPARPGRRQGLNQASSAASTRRGASTLSRSAGVIPTRKPRLPPLIQMRSRVMIPASTNTGMALRVPKGLVPPTR